ncbi:MAG: xanthine dehydrogenase family protein molybdopterin-binding subunit [Acidobacteria bacterium]|nr:xanthine dehydrogenase family protein molybdopterin-binding subunit [Acidobacteriota bacterium]
MRTASSTKSNYPVAMTPDALAALENAGFSRRNFLKRAGALIVTFSMAGSARKLAAQSPVQRGTALNQVDSWIAIARDESITAYSGKCEFGQGFSTVQYQLIAEELNVPLDRITLIFCDTFLTPDQGVTSGSQSHPAEFGATGLRQALATAREALFQMASQQLNVPVDQLMVEDGVIKVTANPSRQMTYGQLIGSKTFNLTLNNRAVVKDPSRYSILGTSVPRYDIPAKVTGEYQYVQNVRVPGMLHGKVVRPPAVGAKVISVNEGSVSGLPGNVKVVVKNDFVGVVADKEWQAIQAAEALEVKWSQGDPLPDQQELYAWMRKQPTRDAYTVLAEDVDSMLKTAARVVSATYLHPYQMHGSLASSCAVADVRGSGSSATATIWSATQGVYPQRDSAAMVLGIPRENVRVIFVEGSGCYGINGADTVSYDAALLSQAVGKPVRVQFTRRDEMSGGENYGPAYVLDLRAGVDDKGQIIAWDYESWTLTKGGRPNATTPGNIITGALVGFPTPALVPARGNPPANYANNGNAASSYGAGVVAGRSGGTGNIRGERVLTHSIASPFFTGPLRSPARLQNTFANESFIDEVAASVKADPVEYRRRHLTDSRLIDVLNAAAKAADWDSRPSPKPGNARTGVVTGRGISCVLYEGDNGYCALVAEVQVDQETGRIVVKRLVASQDSGPVSNPDGLRNQMEGGVLQGMSRALREEVRWDEQAITSTHWRTYPVYQFGEPLPVVETVLVNRPDQPHMGAGECTITTVAAAIANAVFDATGARLRQIPFIPARVLLALRSRG